MAFASEKRAHQHRGTDVQRTRSLTERERQEEKSFQIIKTTAIIDVHVSPSYHAWSVLPKIPRRHHKIESSAYSISASVRLFDIDLLEDKKKKKSRHILLLLLISLFLICVFDPQRAHTHHHPNK